MRATLFRDDRAGRWTVWLMVAALLLLAAAPCLSAPPELTLPAEVKGERGAFIKIAAKTSGKTVRWLALDKGLNLFPVELLKDSKTAVVTAREAGKYRLLAVTAAGDEISEPAVVLVVVNGDAPPGPPGPGPTPPPGPETALQKAVRDAYAAEADADKAKHCKALAGVYRAAAAAVAAQKPATMGAVWKAIEAGAKAAGVAGRIQTVQRAIQAEWKRLPARSTDALDEAKRALISEVFGEIALALEKLEAKHHE